MEKMEGVLLPESRANKSYPIDYSPLVVWGKHPPISAETKGHIFNNCQFSDIMAHCSRKNRHVAAEEFSAYEILDLKYKHTEIRWYKLD